MLNMLNKIHVELTEPEVRLILWLCRLNEFTCITFESLIAGTELTDHKATAATLKREMNAALQRQQALVAQVAAAEAERAATGVVPFPAAAGDDRPADIPLQR
jgi:hypothetical protein